MRLRGWVTQLLAHLRMGFRRNCERFWMRGRGFPIRCEARCSRLCAKLDASLATVYLNRLFVKTGVGRAYKNCD